jgi:hypothetical protein
MLHPELALDPKKDPYMIQIVNQSGSFETGYPDEQTARAEWDRLVEQIRQNKAGEVDGAYLRKTGTSTLLCFHIPNKFAHKTR